MQRAESMFPTQAVTNQNPEDSRDVDLELIRSSVSSTPKRSKTSKIYDTRKINQCVEVTKEIASKEVRRSSRSVKFFPEKDNELLKGIQQDSQKCD